MKQRTLWMAALAAGTLALAGCFGGSDDHDDGGTANGPLDAVPATASADTGGFIAYLKSLVALQAEDREPVGIDAVTPPQSDTTEPEAVS
ncbi:hypothetical protein [uncultured Aquincola sp.]|mgnify:CR=1 FL=1|uniref:hypothetical protein n=1 Tax=uncultured Aquincola sp. TaxID=886556 RepID=UPI0032B1D226